LEQKWVIVLIVVILGGTALIENYMSTTFPVVEYSSNGLPDLEVGKVRRYSFSRGGKVVGRYQWWVEKIEDYEGERAYFTWSLTNLTMDGRPLWIKSLYIHTPEFMPLEYRSNATLSDERREIICKFDSLNVNEEIVVDGESLSYNNSLSESTVLVDNNMLAHWDLLLKTFTPEHTQRTSINTFVPQSTTSYEIQLSRDKNTKTIKIGEVDYECTVVREGNWELDIYLYEGDIIRYHDNRNDVTITWQPN